MDTLTNPRERTLELLVADLRQTATMLQRDLERAHASPPTAIEPDVSGPGHAALVAALGEATLRAEAAERKARGLMADVSALRQDVLGMRELYTEADQYSSAYSTRDDMLAAIIKERDPAEPDGAVLARVAALLKATLEFDPPADGDD